MNLPFAPGRGQANTESCAVRSSERVGHRMPRTGGPQRRGCRWRNLARPGNGFERTLVGLYGVVRDSAAKVAGADSRSQTFCQPRRTGSDCARLPVAKEGGAWSLRVSSRDDTSSSLMRRIRKSRRTGSREKHRCDSTKHNWEHANTRGHGRERNTPSCCPRQGQVR